MRVIDSGSVPNDYLMISFISECGAKKESQMRYTLLLMQKKLGKNTLDFIDEIKHAMLHSIRGSARKVFH